MTQIRRVLERDLDRKIEEIIQLDQADEHAVYTEISEYVVTDSIQRQYRELLEAINEARFEPTGGIGVWISGFFGSGKSSFAKNLGYVLGNRNLRFTTRDGAEHNYRAVDLFKERVNDQDIADLIDIINANMDAEVIMFDVQKDRASQGGPDISPFVYRVLLRHLGYAENFDVAELEITLEARGELDDFIERHDRRYAAERDNSRWMRQGRSGALALNHASAILYEMDPSTYPSPDSYVASLRNNWYQPTPKTMVERTFELMERRRPGRVPVFIIDEVGQYVAYSQDRLENLRAVVEEFAREGSNRLRVRKIPAQPWFMVTSQERLDEVVSAIGDQRRVSIAKVRDRFAHEVDLSPSDVREVAARRVLSKTDDGVKELRELFASHEGQLNTACHLESRARKSEVGESEFIEFYPYLPHYLDLSIDIMSGIRLQPGAPKQVGGANRTIIRQVYEMLVNPRTAFADKQTGALVTLDAIYELIEGQVGSSKQRDISEIMAAFRDDPDDEGWSGRTAKALALLEFVRDLPRTPANIAAVLVDRIGSASPVSEVEAALERLTEAQFVRDTGEGYKLQTEEEKSWEQEKRGYRELRPRERNEIKRDIVAEIFGETNLKRYQHKNLRTFTVGVTVDSSRIGGEGQIPLSVLVAEGESDWPAKTSEARHESRDDHERIYWVLSLTPEIDDLVASYHASDRMIAKYQQVQAVSHGSHDITTSLSQERNEQRRLRNRLVRKFSDAIAAGQGFFQGVAYDASNLGQSPVEIFRSLFGRTVPDLYPKLEMGTVRLRGSEAEEILKAASLNGLSQVFYGGEDGLGLIVPEGAKYVLNTEAPTAKEILDYLRSEQDYGNKVTGKILGDRFGGMPYGWDRDALQVVLAALLRFGNIEVMYQGRLYRNHQEPTSRVPLTSAPAFRAASFAPRKIIDLSTLISAVRQYEQITGDDVDVEEGAISAAFKDLASDELDSLLPVISEVNANSLPVRTLLNEYRDTLKTVLDATSDDAVRILAGEGTSFRETRDRIRRIREAISTENVARISRARDTLGGVWPVLRNLPEGLPFHEDASQLQELIESDTFYEKLGAVDDIVERITGAYQEVYLARHNERFEAFSAEIENLKGHPGWAQLRKLQDEGDADDVADDVLIPLTSRACEHADLSEGATVCRNCAATLSQMESDIAALSGLRVQVLSRIIELTTPEPRVERVRLASFFNGGLQSAIEVEEALEHLKTHLLALVEDDVQIIIE